MPAPSEEELDELRKRNEKLREQVATQQAKASDNDAERAREYEASQLLIENTRLEAQLASAKERAKVGVSRDGASNLLDAADTQLAAAQAALENPQGVPVDTNAEDQPKNTTGATTAVEDGVVEIAQDGTATVTAPEKSSSTSSSSSSSRSSSSSSAGEAGTDGSATTTPNGGN